MVPDFMDVIPKFGRVKVKVFQRVVEQLSVHGRFESVVDTHYLGRNNGVGVHGAQAKKRTLYVTRWKASAFPRDYLIDKVRQLVVTEVKRKIRAIHIVPYIHKHPIYNPNPAKPSPNSSVLAGCEISVFAAKICKIRE